MFEINEITYYKTQDGESFGTYEEAEEHNKLLMKKEIPFNEISIFNKDGDWIPVDSMLDYDKVWFFYADTDNGARFLEHFISEHISLEEDIEIKPKELYRYDESIEAGRKYRVLYVAKHGAKRSRRYGDRILCYIQECNAYGGIDDCAPCYLINIEGVEKI